MKNTITGRNQAPRRPAGTENDYTSVTLLCERLDRGLLWKDSQYPQKSENFGFLFQRNQISMDHLTAPSMYESVKPESQVASQQYVDRDVRISTRWSTVLSCKPVAVGFSPSAAFLLPAFISAVCVAAQFCHPPPHPHNLCRCLADDNVAVWCSSSVNDWSLWYGIILLSGQK